MINTKFLDFITPLLIYIKGRGPSSSKKNKRSERNRRLANSSQGTSSHALSSSLRAGVGTANSSGSRAAKTGASTATGDGRRNDLLLCADLLLRGGRLLLSDATGRGLLLCGALSDSTRTGSRGNGDSCRGTSILRDVGGGDAGHLGRDDAIRDTGSVVLATTLVTAVVVSEDRLVVCRASVTELVGTLRAGDVITSTGLVNEDFASGARREGLQDESFCSLVLKVAIALTNLTHGLTVANVARDRNRGVSG